MSAALTTQTPPPATAAPTTIVAPLAEAQTSLLDHDRHGTSRFSPSSKESIVLHDQALPGFQMPNVMEAPTSPPGQLQADPIHLALAGRGPILRDQALGFLATTVADLETLRMGLAARYNLLIQPTDVLDKDGVARGFGLEPSNPMVQTLKNIAVGIGGEPTKRERLAGKVIGNGETAGSLEYAAIKELKAQMKRHPLGPWLADPKRKGVGEKTLARLLNEIGDPYWNDLYNRPRTLGELYAYTGMHVVDGQSPRRRKGQKANWNNEARKRLWLIVSAVIYHKDGYYGQYWDLAMEKYADATHSYECAQCSPKGKPPAPAGSELSKGHKRARAQRLTAKRILEDIWEASRDIHLQEN